MFESCRSFSVNLIRTHSLIRIVVNSLVEFAEEETAIVFFPGASGAFYSNTRPSNHPQTLRVRSGRGATYQGGTYAASGAVSLLCSGAAAGTLQGRYLSLADHRAGGTEATALFRRQMAKGNRGRADMPGPDPRRASAYPCATRNPRDGFFYV